MSIMDTYHDNEKLPEGLREAIGKNGAATKYWCALTPEKRQAIAKKAAELAAPDEIQSYVDELVGWEKGHEPYQL